jgi:Domain of unknown function (DUF4232)
VPVARIDSSLPDRRAPRPGLVAGVLVVGAVLAACSSATTSSTARTTGRSTTTTRSTAAPTTTGPVSGGASTTAAGPVRCSASQVSGSVVGSTGAAGTIEVTLALKNVGGSTCTLGGYPGLQLQASSGAALPTTVVRKGTYAFTSMPPTTVTVAPGQSVYVNIGYSDVPTGNGPCPSSASLEVTPPNDTDHLVVSAAITACGAGTLTVSPVFLATGANTQTTAPPTG